MSDEGGRVHQRDDSFWEVVEKPEGELEQIFEEFETDTPSTPGLPFVTWFQHRESGVKYKRLRAKKRDSATTVWKRRAGGKPL